MCMHISTMKVGRHREDREKNVLKGHSFFVRFMERHGLGDCIKYFPDTMTLGDLRCLTTYDLMSRYDLKDPKDCERILKVVSISFKEDQSDSELECGSSPKQNTCQNAALAGCHKDVGQLHIGRTLCRAVSEDMRFPMRTKDKFSLFNSTNSSNYFMGGFRHFSSQYGLNQASSGSSVCNDSGNLFRLNILGLGKSAPSLSTCQKDHGNYGTSVSSATRQFSSRLSFRNPSLALTSSSLSLAHQTSHTPNVPSSPADSPRTGNMTNQNFQFHFLLGKNLVDNRRWSVASLASSGSGNNTPACPSSANLFSSQDRLFGHQHPPLRHQHHHHHHLHHHHHQQQQHSATPDRQHFHRHFSSSDSNPTSLNDNGAGDSSPACSLPGFVQNKSSRSPLTRPRSQSLSSPAKSSGSDSGTMLLNNIYKERFPKAVLQMEENLKQFVENCQHLESSPVMESDGAMRFVCRQIVELAKDCLGKSRENLISIGYFYELSENLEKLLKDAKDKSHMAVDQIAELIKKLLIIISRPARLLECLEFDPQEFYRFLEFAEGHARETIKTDIPRYIVSKLALTKDSILPEFTDVSSIDSGRPDTPEAEEFSESGSLSTVPATNKLEKLQMLSLNRQPNQDDFETIKLVSNGAYGAVYLVRHKESRRIFAMKRLLKSNLVLRNQVDQVFVERDILTFTDNPFVVSFFCSFETKKHLCMVLEYVEGGDCATLLKNVGGPLSFDLARMYFAETVLALEYLHSYGIVHRDLKPDNLLITLMGHIKLTDFGLSKMGLMNLTTNVYERSVDRDCKQFKDKQVFGTPEYIAPEVILRQGYGKPVDWWAMGIILYEFLVGCVPFFGDTPEELFTKIINDTVEWPQEDEFCPPADAQDLILQLLSHNPLERLGSGGTLEVKEHLFFEGLDWNGLLRLKAEFVPNLASDEDTSYFDSRLDRYNPEGEDTDDSEDIMFNSFSSCSPRYSKVYLKFEEFRELEKQQNESQMGDGSDKQSLEKSVQPMPSSSSSSPSLKAITSEISTSQQPVTSTSSLDRALPVSAVESSCQSVMTTFDVITTSIQDNFFLPPATTLTSQPIRTHHSTLPSSSSASLLSQQKPQTSTLPHSLSSETEGFHVKLRHPEKVSGISIKKESKLKDDAIDGNEESENLKLKYFRRNIKVIESGDAKADNRVEASIPIHVSSFPHIHLRRMHTKGKLDLPKFSFSTEDSTDSALLTDKDKEDQDQLGPLRPLVPSKSAPTMPHVCEGDKPQVILVAPKEFKRSPLALEPNKPVPKSSSSLLFQAPGVEAGKALAEVLPEKEKLVFDQSPGKSSITMKKGGRGYGFTLRAIRVYYGDSQYYTLHHLVVAIENGGPAMEAGLKAGDLITHVNNTSVQGLLHIELVRLILSGGNKVTMKTTPLSSTTIRLGNRKQTQAGNFSLECRYVQPVPNVRYRRSFGSSKSLEDKKKRSSLFRRLSNRKVEQLVSSPVFYHQHPCHNFHQKLSFSSDGSSSIPDSPTLKLPSYCGTILTPSPTSCGTMTAASPTPSPWKVSKSSNELLSSSSPGSSSPGSPALLESMNQSSDRSGRPSSLYGLRHHPRIHGGKVHKTNSLQLQCSPSLSCNRRRSWHNNPLSPLVKTPSSSPLGTPVSRSPSPSLYHLHHPGISKMSQLYNPSNARFVHPPHQYRMVPGFRPSELTTSEGCNKDGKSEDVGSKVQKLLADSSDMCLSVDCESSRHRPEMEASSSKPNVGASGVKGSEFAIPSSDSKPPSTEACIVVPLKQHSSDIFVDPPKPLQDVASPMKPKTENKPGRVSVIPVRVIPQSSSPSYTSIYIPKSPAFKVSPSPLKTSTFQFPPVKPQKFVSEMQITHKLDDPSSSGDNISACIGEASNASSKIPLVETSSSCSRSCESDKTKPSEADSSRGESASSSAEPTEGARLPQPRKCDGMKMQSRVEASPQTFQNETKTSILAQEKLKSSVKVNIKVEKRKLFKK